ncbi:MAG TPA: zinc ABC transporter substrate-binding protein [Gemmataceae bacterium]|nr:zinc ABC transporter substrate-binding protein [Gemmataceae bacterium]
MAPGRKTIAGAAGLLLLGLAGCGSNDTDPRTKVVCTTGMVADFVRNIGGVRVRVTQLMGEGVDPHRYKASIGDVHKLNGADIVFYSGLHLEGKMGDIFERTAARRPTYAVAEGIDTKYRLQDEQRATDPHLWFDVSLWSQGASVVRDALMKFDPANASEYKARADAYQAELAKLHEYARAQLALIPKDRRVLVTAHDAFQYFGRAYDIEVKGIQGISTETEAGLKDINDLVEFIVQRKVKAVFVETSVNERNMRALLEGCQAKGHQVVIGGELFSDAMGKDGTPEGTYVGMVRHNVDTIVKALK